MGGQISEQVRTGVAEYVSVDASRYRIVDISQYGIIDVSRDERFKSRLVVKLEYRDSKCVSALVPLSWNSTGSGNRIVVVDVHWVVKSNLEAPDVKVPSSKTRM